MSAFLEVKEGLTAPAAYAEHWDAASLPFDYVWFTPRIDDVDPCEKFKKSLEDWTGNKITDDDLRKVAGQNVLRAMARAETVAVRLQAETRPNDARIEEVDGKR